MRFRSEGAPDRRIRAAAALFGFALVASIAPARAAGVEKKDDKLYIDGVSSAHGYGLAMDGVEGQARHGWDHQRILSLFYAGTTPGRFGGTIRVWLTEGGSETFSLPSGGVVLDGPQGRPIETVRAGGTVGVKLTPDGLKVTATKTEAPSKPIAAETSPTPDADPEISPDPDNPAGTPIPTVVPTPPPQVPKATPKPTPKRTVAPATAVPDADVSVAKKSAWIVPQGNPAITGVAATGRRYRGTIEVRRGEPGALRVINHVDLETYVAGIAEEKGAGWPPEAMKVLAIAARSLAASTMTWYGHHHAEGYDICPDANCQVYLGYDGEAPDMREAQAATAGQIRTWAGRSILAMYHGNGGGQTETYGDSHPYLKSVKYPYADPYSWHVETTFTEIAEKLRSKEIAPPDPVQLIKVTKRGVSPRVQEVEVAGGSDEVVSVRGTDFATALELPSTWFFLSKKKNAKHYAKTSATIAAPPGAGGSEIARSDVDPTGGFSWPLAIGAFLSFVVAAMVSFAMRRPDRLAALRWVDLRPLVLRRLRSAPGWLRLSRSDSSG
jgi:SpoIID/LytB domain protein